MPETDPVEVIVELIDRFSDEIVKLKRELDSIEDVLDVLLYIDDNGQIRLTATRLDALARDRFVNLFVKEHVVPDGGRVIRDSGLFDLPADSDALIGFRRMFAGDGSFMDEVMESITPTRLDRVGQIFGRANRRVANFASTINRGAIGQSIQKIDDAARFAIPTWHKWIQLFSLLIPLLITVAVAALGAATAFAAVAGAGAAVVGLGLIGEGDSIAEAFENARQKVDQFKEALFEVFQPTAQVFEPFTNQFLDVAPRDLKVFADALEELTVFADSFQNAFRGIAEWLARAARVTASYEREIEELASTFGQIAGNLIIDFLSFLVEETYRNQDAFIQLGSVFADILGIIYNLSKAFSFIVAAMRPAFDILLVMSELLTNKWIIGLITAVSVWYGLGRAIMFASAAFTVATEYLAGLNGALALTNAQLLTTATLVSVATAGLALLAGFAAMKVVEGQIEQSTTGSLGGSLGGPVPGSSPTMVVNVDGDVTKKHRRKLEDYARRTYSTESEYESTSRWP